MPIVQYITIPSQFRPSLQSLLCYSLMANSLHLHPDPTEPSELLDPQPYGMVVLAAVIEGSIPVVELG